MKGVVALEENAVNAISAAIVATAVTAIVALVLFAGSLVFSIGVSRQSLTYERLLSLGTPFVIAITMAIGAMEALSRPYDLWDEPRFALTLAISHGIPMYPPPDQGAQLPSVYLPVAPFLYLPATLATRPDVAMVIAGIIAQIFFRPHCLPLPLASRRRRSEGGRPATLHRPPVVVRVGVCLHFNGSSSLFRI
jgi:hypothetical protein